MRSPRQDALDIFRAALKAADPVQAVRRFLRREGSVLVAGTRRYPLTRYIYFVLPTSGSSPTLTKFIDWARRSSAAYSIINNAGGVSVFNKKPKAKRRS